MKKFTLLLVIMLSYTGFTMAQTIENFESIKMNSMAFGTTGMMTVVPNPNPVGDTSMYCVEFIRPGKTNGGEAYSGFWSAVPVAVDVTVNKYVHVKVWKTRISPVKFKLQGGTDGDSEIFSMNPQTKMNEWEEIVFDFTAKTGTYPIVAFMPDFEDPLVQVNDLTMYFDDIYVNNDPAVESAPVQMIENWEVIPMTMMINDPLTDMSSMTAFTPNPDKSGINMSDNVVKFVRDKDGLIWGGFFADNITGVIDSIDLTTNKFIHVKVWKPRISALHFKVYNGKGGSTEIPSKYLQTKTNAWEDIVFDFRTKTGKYSGISFMPDFNDPVNLSENDTIYFDDIVLNNDSTKSVYLTLNVDMHGAGLVTGDKVYVAGTFPDLVAPGVDPALMMTDADGDSIYTVSMVVPAGHKAFKFYINAGYDGGEWTGGTDRMIELAGDAVVNAVWGQPGFVGVRENPLAGKIQMYPNPVRNELNINTNTDIRRVIITNTVGKVVGNMVYTNNKTISTSDLSRGMYFVTFIGKDGSKVTQKLIKN